jgi:hypothetical protein
MIYIYLIIKIYDLHIPNIILLTEINEMMYLQIKIIIYIRGIFFSLYGYEIYIYLWPYSPFDGPWPLFQFLNHIHSRWDSLDR